MREFRRVGLETEGGMLGVEEGLEERKWRREGLGKKNKHEREDT